MSSDLQGALLVGLLAIGAVALGWHVLARVWREQMPRLGMGGRVGMVVMILSAAAIGGDKSPAMRYVATLVTALRSGALLDPSGRIGAAAGVAASQEIAQLSVGIIGAASQTVTDAQAQFDAAAEILTNRALTVAYIAADLPRAMPDVWTNHNIAATIERAEQEGGTNLVIYVWYTQEPSIVPQVSLACSVALNAWETMQPVTNSYPDTTEIAGVPCVRYVYSIPPAIRGTVLRPEYELQFGAPSSPLIVPSGGLLVETNGMQLPPYTGTDVYSPTLSVRYQGGVAVEADWNGTNYTGVVP